jgi:hypothetical protein
VLSVDEVAGRSEVVLARPGSVAIAVVLAVARSVGSGTPATGDVLTTQILQQEIEVECAEMASGNQQHP